MKLQQSTVDVFLSTLDQQSPKTAKPMGRLVNLVNAKVTQYQNPRAADGTVTHVRVEKRDGFAATTNAVRDLDGAAAGTLNGEPQVLFEGDVLREIASNRLFTRSGSAWVKASSHADGDTIVLPQIVRTSDLYAADSQCEAPDAAVIGDIECVAWRELAVARYDNSSTPGTTNAANIDGVRVMFRDQATGAPVRAPFKLDPTFSNPAWNMVRVRAWGGRFWVLQDYTLSGTVARIYVTVFDPTGVQVAQASIDTPSQGLHWDAAVIPGTGVVVAQPNNGAGVKFTSFTYSAGIVTASNTDTSIKCEGAICAWLTDDSGASHTSYLGTVSVAGGITGTVYGYTIVSLAKTHEFPVTVGSFVIGTQTVSGITGYADPYSTGLVIAYTLMDLIGEPEATRYGASGTDPSNTTASNAYPNQMHNLTVTSLVPFSGTSTLIANRLGMSLVSRAFNIAGDYVAIGYYPARKWGPLERSGAGGNHLPYRPFNPSDFQPTWYVLPLAAAQPIAGRLEYGLACADWQVVPTSGTPGPRNRALTSVSVSSSGALTLPLCFRAEQNIPTAGAYSDVAGGTNPSGTPSGLLAGYVNAALSRVLAGPTPQQQSYQTADTVGVREFRFGPDCGQAFTVNRATYWPGLMAAVTEPGDATVTEHGIVAPECPWAVLTATTDTLLRDGTYFYRVVSEYTTSTGKSYQSLPSAAFSYTTHSGDNKALRLNGSNLYPTNKKNVKLSLYRTAYVTAALAGSGAQTTPPTSTTPTPVAGATSGYYKITDDRNPLYTNSPSYATEWNYTDFLESFTQATGTELYSDLGVLPKFPCPANRGGCVWQNRAWVIGYDNALWFSGEIAEGQGEWFNPALRVVVPTTEEITSVAAMEGFLLIGCARSWWYVPLGQSLPDATGAGTVPTPVRLPFEMGCTGFSAVIKDGCLYASSEGGVWMITRALNNEWVGQAAQDDLAGELTGMCVSGNYVLVNTATGSPQRVMAYDTNLAGWAAWNIFADNALVATAGGLMVWADSGRVFQQAPGTWLDVDANEDQTFYVAMSATVAPVHIGGVRSWKRTWALQIEGDVFDACVLNTTLLYGDSGTDIYSPPPKALAVGELEEEIRPSKQLVASMGITVSDSQGATLDTGRGLSWEVVSFDVGLEQGLKKLGTGKRV